MLVLDSIRLKKSSLFFKKTGLTRSTKEKSARIVCGPESSSPARRGVSFAKTGKKDTCATLARSDMTKEEILSAWYDDNDCRVIKMAILQILRKMVKGTDNNINNNNDIDSCLESDETRGLENKTPKGSRARKKNRNAGLHIVLDEQDRQRDYGLIVDSDYIAQLYSQSSVRCQMEAVRIAANDAKLIYDHQEETETTMTSSTATTATTTTTSAPELSPPKIVPTLASPIPNRRALAYSSIVSPLKTRSRRRLLAMMS